ncbi:MAG: hypothetical protein IPJ81_04005 [Chitinophagaceae bacterium]|nr:hypothetical protein [Chitinophagaceae bacterium]
MKWLYFILSHSIFIALCAAGLALQTIQLLHLSASAYIHGFIFFAVVSSYNFYWLLSKYSFRSTFSSQSFLHKEITSICIFFAAIAGMLICYVQHIIPIAIILPALVLTCLYCLPLIPVKFFYFARKAGVLKTLVLSFTWTYVTVIIPLQKPLLDLNNAELFLLSRRFLFMLMLCIIFDTRDVIIDKVRGLHSLATDLSPKMLKCLILVIFLILFTTNFLFRFYGITFAQSVALQVSTIILLITYFFSTKKQGYLFYYFGVDGLMLFSALATYLASI